MRTPLSRILGLGLVAASGLAAPAEAHWQWTRWGMSPDEVVAASQGTARLGAPPEGKTYQNFMGRALGAFEGDGASFHAFFPFDGFDKLARVALERIGGTACAELHGGLLRKLGKPVKSNRTSFATIDEFHDRAGGNVVRYVAIGELPCTITYDRLP